MRFVYSLLITVLLSFILLRLLLRSRQIPAYRQRVLERFGFIAPAPKADGIWVHAVSVGEAIAAVKLVKTLQVAYPDLGITITCGTPTGSSIIQEQLGDSVYHVYLPYDFPFAVQRFLRKIQPKIGIIMETELWPNLFHYAAQNQIKLMIVNMRLSDQSFKNYRKFPKFISSVLAKVSYFAVQTRSDAERVQILGAQVNKIKVLGNLKFDLEPASSGLEKKDIVKKIGLDQRQVWLAASTHEGEDSIVLKVHKALIRQQADLLLVIAPRHPERFKSVYALCQTLGKTERRSDLAADQTIEHDTQTLLLDSMGEISFVMPSAKWAFVGGSLVQNGGHNILEACGAGVPVLFGPYMDNFRLIADKVKQAKAGVQVRDEKALLAQSMAFLEQKALGLKMGQNGKTLMKDNQGALSETMRIIATLLQG